MTVEMPGSFIYNDMHQGRDSLFKYRKIHQKLEIA